MMRAVRLRTPDGLDGLVVEDVEVPRPGPGEALVRVHAAAIIKAKGMTLSELARLLGKERNTVKSWLVQSIPMAQAKRIEDILGVPATLASYPAGIRQ